ncbi:MAG: ImmA/IrrE family metallo-endopeptidase [Eubacteriales bacterium]|nr:ImmA/IrrE family metallo-endopeptidase [Eubacteriales bacterium]
MSRQYISSKVERLIRRWKTRDPFELLDALHVVVKESDAYQSLKGFCFTANRTFYVVINSTLPPEVKRIVAAHELGHIVMHRKELKMAPMRDVEIYQMNDRTEYEANVFAAELLVSDQDVDALVQEDELDYFGICRTLNVSPDLMSFKLFGLIQRGHDYNMPMGMDSRFLGK